MMNAVNKKSVLVIALFVAVMVLAGVLCERLASQNRQDSLAPNSEGYRPIVLFYSANTEAADGDAVVSFYTYPREIEINKLLEQGMSEPDIVAYYKNQRDGAVLSYSEHVARLRENGMSNAEIDNMKYI